MSQNGTLFVAFLIAGAAFAQTPETTLRATVLAIHYAPLAEQARIQGDVHVNVSSGVVKILSGHPLLAQTVVESAKAFASILGRTDLDVTYHFALVDTTTSVATQRTVKRGNALERAVLRLFGFKTEKVVVDYQCVEGVAPPSDFKETGSSIDVWIYGRSHCLQTEASTLVAVRH